MDMATRDKHEIYLENIRLKSENEQLDRHLKNPSSKPDMEFAEFPENIPPKTENEHFDRHLKNRPFKPDTDDAVYLENIRLTIENKYLEKHLKNITSKADTYDARKEIERIMNDRKSKCRKNRICGVVSMAVILCLLIAVSVFAVHTWNNMITKSDMNKLLQNQQTPQKSASLMQQLLGTNSAVSGSLLSHSINVGLRSDYRLQECQGSQFKQTFPDVDYALLGYNILKGFPNAGGLDPGFTYPIFVADYSKGLQTSDCRYSIPSGLVVVPDVSCVTSFTSETVQTKYQLAKSLSVSASVSGGGWGVSFSASAGYKESSSEISTGESVYILSTAKCLYYFSKLVEDKSPSFSDIFKDWIYKLNNSDAQETYFEFLEIYGTHFSTYVKFGSRYTYQHKMSSKAFQSQRSKGVNVNVQASYSGLFSVGGGFGLDSSQQESASNFSKSVETKTITVGAPPPANGDAMTWASSVKESPVPMEYKLKSIENLFTEKYMKNMDVDYMKIAENIKNNKYKYCNYLKAEGKLDSCDSLSPGILLENTRLHQHFKSRSVATFGECIDMCLQEFTCEAITFCKSCSDKTCFMYRNGNNLLVTASENTDWESMVFISQISNHLKFSGAKINGVPRSSEAKTQAISLHSDCKKLCENDAYCVAYSFNNLPQQNRCKLFAENRVKGLKEETEEDVYFISYQITSPESPSTTTAPTTAPQNSTLT